jgi:hypothetical protein
MVFMIYMHLVVNFCLVDQIERPCVLGNGRVIVY